jgi:hypothetical protein
VEIIKLLSQFIDVGVDGEELRQIALAALAHRLRDLKLSIGVAVVDAQGELMEGCLPGVDRSLQKARRLGEEYRSMYRQWCGLYRQEACGPGPGTEAGSAGGDA